MNGEISDVCAFWRSTPAGSSSISTSCGSATAASVPSNGRYANDAVEPTMATPITTTHVKDDEDLIFEVRCLIRTPLLRSPIHGTGRYTHTAAGSSDAARTARNSRSIEGT